MDMVRTLIDTASCFLELLLCMYFFSAFKDLRFRKLFTYSIVIICGCLYSGALYYFQAGANLFLVSLVLTFIVSLCYRYKWYFSIFMTIIISVISGLSELIITGLGNVFGVDYSSSSSNVYVYIVALFATKTITYLIILIIRKGKHSSFTSIKNMKFAQLMLLPVATVAIAIVFSYYIIYYNASEAINIGSVISLFILITSNVMIFSIIDAQDELISVREKLKSSRVLMENQKTYYEDAFKSQQETRKTRHDLKNIFIAVLNELNSGNTDRSKEILQKKLSELEQYIYIDQSYDNVIDAVIYSKQKEAEAQKVIIDMHKSVNQRLYFDDLDLTVLVANLLDNAIEATSKVDVSITIEFSFITEQENLIITTRNPTVNIIEEGGRLHTTKKDKSWHGYGLMSIESIVDKYNGEFIWDYTEGVFSVTIILPNRRISA